MGLLHCSRRRRSSRREVGKEEEMATGEITTLPSTPEDGGSGGFPPGSFKEPKRLYCKNGGFFLRIKSDGGVDGIREKNDPHSEYTRAPFTLLCTAHKASLCSFFYYAQGSKSEAKKKKKIMEERCEFSSLLRLILHL